jgi:hypothetical protein
MRQRLDAERAAQRDRERAAQADRERLARIKAKEPEVIALIDDAVAALNAQSSQALLTSFVTNDGRDYRYSDRVLTLRFFRPGELYDDPIVPGRMETLRQHHAAHGGLLEIKENGEDREGWNLVLVMPSEASEGEWRIVETRVSALTGRVARFEPFATEARLFADNLACHWSHAMHTFILRDRPVERQDVVEVLRRFASM